MKSKDSDDIKEELGRVGTQFGIFNTKISNMEQEMQKKLSGVDDIRDEISDKMNEIDSLAKASHEMASVKMDSMISKAMEEITEKIDTKNRKIFTQFADKINALVQRINEIKASSANSDMSGMKLELRNMEHEIA